MLLTVAVIVGNVLFTGVSDNVLAFARAFAASAVLASLADTVMSDAYRQGGPLVAFATAAGFLLAFLISQKVAILGSGRITSGTQRRRDAGTQGRG